MNHFLCKLITAISIMLLPVMGVVTAQTYVRTIPNTNYFSIAQLSSGDLVLAGQRQQWDTAVLVSKYTTGGHHLQSNYIWQNGGVSLDDAHASHMLYNDKDSLLVSVYISGGAQGGAIGAVTKLTGTGNTDWYKRYKVGVSSGNVRGGGGCNFQTQTEQSLCECGLDKSF